MQDSDIILLDVHPDTKGDYVGFGMHFLNIFINGKLRLPAEPMGLIIDCQTTQQLYLFSGYIGLTMDRKNITNVFPMRCRAHKFSSDPLMLRSNLIFKDVLSSLTQESNDIANRLIRENLQAISKGFSLLSTDKKGIVHYIQNSWSEIAKAAMYVQTKSNRAKEEAKIQMESLLGLTMHLLENSKNIRSRELMERHNAMHSPDLSPAESPVHKGQKTFDPIDSMENDKNQYTSSEKQLVTNLRTEIQSNYKRLLSLSENCNKYPSEILNAVEDIDRTVRALDNSLDKLQHLTILSSNQTPSYCGWMKKSSGFSKSDRSVIGKRYWCLLIRDSLYFLDQPYGKKVEYEVYLDKSFIAHDPDDDIETNAKTSLSSLLWISNPESGSIDEGVLVLDCITLDEKCMWIENLKPWIPVDPNLIKKSSRSKIKLPFHFGSSNSSIQISSNDSKLSESPQDVPTASLHTFSDGKAASRIRAVSKGMLRAISMSRSGVKSTLNTVANATAAAITSNERNPISPIVAASRSATAIKTQIRRMSDTARDASVSSHGEDIERESISSFGSAHGPGSSMQNQMLIQQSSERGLQSSMSVTTAQKPELSSFVDILDELDDLRAPLYNYGELMEQIKASYVTKYQEIRHMVDNMRDSFLAMFLGLSILHTIEDEVRERFDIP